MGPVCISDRPDFVTADAVYRDFNDLCRRKIHLPDRVVAATPCPASKRIPAVYYLRHSRPATAAVCHLYRILCRCYGDVPARFANTTLFMAGTARTGAGGDGKDTFLFSRGSGVDWVRPDSVTARNDDVVRMGGDILPGQVGRRIESRRWRDGEKLRTTLHGSSNDKWRITA